MENKAAGQYLARVKRTLVCDKTDRCRLLERCAAMIGDFQQENPEVGYDGIVAAFGEPDAFVSELLSGLDEATVKAARKRRRLIRWGAAVAIIAVPVVISVFWYIQYQKSMLVNDFATIVMENPYEITQDEFDNRLENTPEERHSDNLYKGE